MSAVANPRAEAPFSAATAAAGCANARRVLVNLWDGDFGPGYALTLMGHPVGPEMLGRKVTVSPEVDLRAAQVSATNAAGLRAATLYVADPEMTTLIDTAAPTMPDQHLAETDLLSPDGFLWFPEPLPDRSGQPPTMPVAALSWSLLPPDHPLLEERGDGEHPVVLIHSYARMRDAPGFPGADDPRLRGFPGLFPTSSTAWTMASLIGSAYGQAPPSEQYAPGFYQRCLAAFWTLARQPLSSSADQPAGDRPARKKAARLGVARPDAPVHVISLRRSARDVADGAAQRTEGTGRKVSVRFAVRGFWRNQYLPSTKTHRQQWIEPHWRGPETGAIQGGERVFLAQGKKRS